MMAEQVMDLNRFVPNGGNIPHKPIHVRINDGDTLTFLCDDPFEITGIALDVPNKPPENPFHRPLRFTSTEGSDGLHRASAGPPKADVRTRRYKVSATVYPAGGGSKPIDPDFIVD
jgi:hypothetical protein